jgi:hypothetical protein
VDPVVELTKELIRAHWMTKPRFRSEPG